MWKKCDIECDAVSCLPIFKLCPWCFQQPSGDSAHGLFVLSRVFGNDLYRRTRACLFCIFVTPTTVPLHYFVNSGSFLWAVHIFSFHVWPFAFKLQVTWIKNYCS